MRMNARMRTPVIVEHNATKFIPALKSSLSLNQSLSCRCSVETRKYAISIEFFRWLHGRHESVDLASLALKLFLCHQQNLSK